MFGDVLSSNNLCLLPKHVFFDPLIWDVLSKTPLHLYAYENLNWESKVISLKRPHFSSQTLRLLRNPILVRIFVGTLDSYFLTHRKNNTTGIHATLFKNMSKLNVHAHVRLYVYILNCYQTVHVSIKYTSGEVCTAKKSWRVGLFFRALVCRVRGRVSPSGSSRAVPSTFCFWRFKAHKWVCAVPSKSQCENTAFWKGKFKSTLRTSALIKRPTCQLFFAVHTSPEVYFIDTCTVW